MPPETNDIKIPDNSEIDQALKEFEEKSKTLPTEVPPLSETSDIPGMVRLVMKFSGRMIKGQKEAEYLLFVFVLVVIGISLYLFLS